LIYRLAFDLGLQERITAEVATCLYTGIMTDTGSFRFPRTTPALHRIVASLIEAGADNVAIHELVYDQYTLSRLHFLGYCLKEKLVVIDELNTAYFAISAEELDQFTIQTGDTEGIVNYALALSGIKLAVLIIQRHDMIKLSFRSTGDFPCNLLANKYFNGGGHKNASGGMSLDNLPGTIKKFTDALVEFRQLLVI
jgi:phosphoesterase RecJ-like protein